MSELTIGLMSGTSVDGIDAALVEFKENQIHLIEFEYFPFSDSIRQAIQSLSQPTDPVFLKEYGECDTRLGHCFAKACIQLLEKANCSNSAITAIGCHGQTIYHAAELSSPFSLQIGDPNIIAEQTGITTVADFRRRDIALGGQGAPLVPAFHQAIFSNTFDLARQHICIVNIGGIANITYLCAEKTIGFDTGPGNTLMDYWVQQHLKITYDKNGDWAKTGIINPQLVNQFKQDPYFQLDAPKSTGKEYFSSNWLAEQINPFADLPPENIQASLCQLTADTLTEAIQQYAPLTEQILICGGGIHNAFLIELIRNNLSQPVSSTADFGINPDHVEAMAFAWLARQTMNNLSGNLTEVTGAKTPAILGGIYPGINGLHRK